MNERAVISDGLIACQIFDKTLLVLSELQSSADHIHCFMRMRNRPLQKRAGPLFRLAVFHGPREHVIKCCPELGIAAVESQADSAWVAFRLDPVLSFAEWPNRPYCGSYREGVQGVVSYMCNGRPTRFKAAIPSGAETDALDTCDDGHPTREAQSIERLFRNRREEVGGD